MQIPGCICRFALGFCKNIKKRTETLYQSFSPFMAGEEGFEPSTKVLETHVLPLHHSPIAHATWIIIGHLRRFVNRFFAKKVRISSGTIKVRKETVYQQKRCFNRRKRVYNRRDGAVRRGVILPALHPIFAKQEAFRWLVMFR